ACFAPDLAAPQAFRTSSWRNFGLQARRGEDLIALLIAISTFSASQGTAVQLAFPNEPGVKAVEVLWEMKKVPAFLIGEQWTTILGVDLDTKPGEHKAEVRYTMQDDRLDK